MKIYKHSSTDGEVEFWQRRQTKKTCNKQTNKIKKIKHSTPWKEPGGVSFNQENTIKGEQSGTFKVNQCWAPTFA